MAGVSLYSLKHSQRRNRLHYLVVQLEEQKLGSAAGGGNPYQASVDLMDQDVSVGKGSMTPTDDDSSAGSSGWDSSDGNSSVDTVFVDSYNPNTIQTGNLNSTPAGNSSSHPTRSSSPSADMDDSTLQEVSRSGSINPAVNPVIQRDVTMLIR